MGWGCDHPELAGFAAQVCSCGEHQTMPVDQQDIERVVDLCGKAGYDATTCGRNVISRVCGVSEKRARTIQTALRSVDAKDDEDSVSFDDALAAYRKWIGMSSPPVYTHPISQPGSSQKIVAAGDFHCPFHHREATRALIEEESGSTDVLVLNGDLGDFWSTSRFPKSKRLVDPCEEMAETQALLTLLASQFRRIIILAGNHDERPKKYFAGLLPPEMMDYVRLTGPMVFKPLEFMAAGLGNVEVKEAVRVEGADFEFICQFGDLVCSHAEAYSIIPNRATGIVNKWVHSFAIPSGVVTGPVRAIVQAHTHQGGSVLGDYGVLCVEGGCMSTLQDYHGSPKIMTPRPLAQGWSVIHQVGGVTDRRESRFIPFKP